MPEDNYKLQTEEYVLPALRASFVSDEFKVELDKIVVDYNLDSRTKELLIELVHDTYIGRLENDEISEKLMDRGGLSWKDAVSIYTILYSELLADLEDELDDQRTLYVDAHPDEFLPPEPTPRDPHEMLADEVVANSGIDLEDNNLRKRLYNIVLAKLKEVRDDEETKANLTKPEKIGGLDFNEGQAATILLLANEAMGQVEERKEEIEQELREHQEMIKKTKEVMQQRTKEADAKKKKPQQEYTKEDAKKIFAGTEDERSQLVQYVSEFAAITDKEKLQQKLLELVKEAAAEQSIVDGLATTACLALMADNGLLVESLKDRGFREEIFSHFPDSEVHEISQKISGDEISAEVMSLFLRGIYHHVIGLSEEESARLGLRVVKAFIKTGRQEYSQLVAFDMNTGVFVWTEHK